METVQLLDHYRLGLAHDELATRILAILSRDGAASDEAIAHAISSPIIEVRDKLTQLYRASLVRVNEQQQWTPTELTEWLLAGLGINIVVADALLGAGHVLEYDRSFLRACCEAKRPSGSAWHAQEVPLLRCSRYVADRLGGSGHAIDRTRLAYAIVVGLDPEFQALGEEAICDDFVRRIAVHVSPGATQGPAASAIQLHQYAVKCRQALADVAHSNRHLMAGELRQAEEPVTYTLTWARVLNVLLSGAGDWSLRAAFHTSPDAFRNACTVLRTCHPSVDRESADFLSFAGKARVVAELTQRTETRMEGLLAALLRLTDEHDVQSSRVEWSRTVPWLLGLERSLPCEPGGLAEQVRAELSRIDSYLQAGLLDAASPSQKEGMRGAVEQLAAHLDVRFATASGAKEGGQTSTPKAPTRRHRKES